MAPNLGAMAEYREKFYTEFLLTDSGCQYGDEFSGIIEVARPADAEVDPAVIEALLARNFDLDVDCVRLLSWSRVH